MLVLVGDAGNHQPDPKGRNKEEIYRLMYENRINMVAFQVISDRDNAYDDFNADAIDFLKKTGEKYVRDPKMVDLTNDPEVGNTLKLSFIVSGGESELFMFGRFSWAPEKKPMDPDILERNVREAASDYLKNVDRQKRLLEQALSGEEGLKGTVFSVEFIEYLKQLGFSPKEIEILKQQGDISTKGYTAMKMYEEASEPCYKHVVFMSRSEKKLIEDILGRLLATGTMTEKKNDFMNALITQCKVMTGGEEMSNEVIINKTLNEVWDIILGIPYPDFKNGKKRLGAIAGLTDNQFEAFYLPFEKSAQAFIRNSFTESRFTLGPQEFYWIPLEKMPVAGRLD
jgi:hypothetical protein